MATMWSRLLCMLVLVAVGSQGALGSSASFFGDSYIHLPLEDASSETDIKLHFRSHQSDAMLFLAAGSPDYCVIEVQSGMVRVRIDLGSGEASLGSPPGVRFDDWQWHYLHLVRSQERVQLTIDGLYTTSTITPGRFFELNINHGIFLGGVGAFTEIFFGNLVNYRGCLRYVIFNSYDIFEDAKHQGDPLNVYGVSWECSQEFGATSQQPISFLQNTSFLAFPHLPARKAGRIIYDIRTRADDALIFYNSGHLSSSDFMAVELLSGKIKLSVNKGLGVNELTSPILVNDGNWHQVEVLVDLTQIRITVDGQKKEGRSAETASLDLHGYLYVGGVSLQARANAINKGLLALSGAQATGGSLIGCLQNIKINGELQGFREAEVTRGLRSECVFTYPCLSNPCIAGAECIEEGYHTFTCVCDRSNCIRTPGSGSQHPAIPVNEVLAVQDLVVREGGRTHITSNNIDILFDYASLGIRESSIIFRVLQQPEHGQIQVNIGQPEHQDVFTLLDMQSGKVSFLHDSSEVSVDSVGLELEFFGSGESLPVKLRQKYGFTLIVKVAPWNDKPVILLPEEDTLILVENTKVKITPKILNVLDKDDEAKNLEYTIQYPQEFDTGYFEITDNLGVRARITSFTQEDINEARVIYIHRGELEADIKIQVSDGKDISDAKILHIHGVPLKLRLVSNTGIVIAPEGGALILHDNLTFATNAPNQDIEVRYDVTEPPYNGEVQRMQYADNTWTTVTTFSQRHVDKSRLRYIHSYPSHHDEDYFKFKVTALTEETDEMIFRIKIVTAKVNILVNSELVLHGVRDERLTGRSLKANSSIPGHGPGDVKYTVLTPPQEGNLLKLEPGRRGNKPTKHRIDTGGSFTQEDLDSKHVMYRLHKALFKSIKDSFQFKVSVPGDISTVETFEIRYEPLDGETQFINNGLEDVIEGESKVITMEEMYMETSNFKDFRFTVIGGPEHGTIQMIDPTTGRQVNKNTTSFTNRDIKDGRVIYQHDNTENDQDSFSFIATPVIDQPEFIVQEITEFSGTFEIKIVLRNDNAPVRIVDKEFNVVSNRGRVLTTDDISFHDPDIDFDSSELVYTWRGIPNGELVEAKNHEKTVEHFSQKELKDGKVYFKHHGANYGRTVIRVTDGQYETLGPFEVRASDPYIRFQNNTGLSILKGGRVPILQSNLSVETNLDADDKDVKFVVIGPPRYGWIRKNGQEKAKFNLADMKSMQLVYEHDNSMHLQDGFDFTVKIEEVKLEGEVNIKVLLESHQDPPRIINSKVMMVDELDHVYITSDNLRVAHPESQDGEIQYSITSYPRHGELMLEGGRRGKELHMFTQADVNAGLLQYTHKTVGVESDVFMFDVTNGVNSLQGLEFVFEIAPKVIPVDVSPFVVVEGETKPLTSDIIQVASKHFQRDPLIFIIVTEPSNGWIESTKGPGVPLMQFTQAQLDEGTVFYVHDGNDSLEDKFSVMVKSRATGKKSNPHTVSVTITPTNDEPPELVVNKKLHVWISSVTPLTPKHLQYVDQDSSPEELMYVVDKPSNGDLALATNLRQNIANFTQAHINRLDVVFIHSGTQERGTFHFRVSDGVHQGKRRTFQIHAKTLELKLVNHKPLEVYPGIMQPISDQHLKAVTNDNNQTRPITFTLETTPQYGRIFKQENSVSAEVDYFTQEDINKGLIFYKHMGLLSSWAEEDAFNFEVSTAYARSLSFKRFRILVSYENINEENRNQLIEVTPLEIEEGSQTVISKEHLDISSLRRRLLESGIVDPDVKYILTALPSHGLLSVGGMNLTDMTEFTQKDINRGRLQYIHDHTDTLWDAFHFKIEIEVGGVVQHAKGRKKSHLDNIFNITIQPINDEPFELLTQDTHLEIIQGSVANITQKELHTVDADTPPGGILYHIQNPPSNGYIVLADDPDRSVEDFTQKQVDDGQVIFIHDGSMESGAFYFYVSDGQFKPFYKVFHIMVHPLTLELHNTSALIMKQGHSVSHLSTQNFNVATNGRHEKIMYNVTKPPKYGELYMHDNPVYQFNQRNINNGEVSYIQTDMSTFKDMFEFILYDSQNLIRDQRIEITVMPLVKTSKPDASSKDNLVLTLNELDASELAALTFSNPVYNITTAPRYGNIWKKIHPVKSIRRKRAERAERKKRKKNGKKKKDKETVEEEEEEDYPEYNEYDDLIYDDYYEYDEYDEEYGLPYPYEDYYEETNPDNAEPLPEEVIVQNFTHQDIVDKTITYKPHKNISEPETDSFGYILSAENAQPAPGVFYISVAPPPAEEVKPDSGGGGDKPKPEETKPASGNKPKPTEPYPTPPEIGANNPPEDPRDQVSGDHLIVIVIVCVVTFITIVITITMRCIRRKRKRKAKQMEMGVAKEDSRTPLAQPHVHIEPQRDLDLNARNMDDQQPIPLISVTPDTLNNMDNLSNLSRSRSRSASPAPRRARSRSRSRSPVPHRHHVGPGPYGGWGYDTAPTRGYRHSTPPPERSPQLAHSGPLSQSHDMLKTEVSKTVPTCKVTPLFDGESHESLGGGTRTPGGTLKRGDTGSLKRDQVTLDWENMDPELLQHCRTTNPVLHDSKYWV